MPEFLTSCSGETLELLDQIAARMREAKFVQVIGHLRPDGDCIGSVLAVHLMLESFGVAHAMAIDQNDAANYCPMPGFELLLDRPVKEPAADLTIYVDSANHERTFADWNAPGDSINIDHHASNGLYAKVNWIEPGCAATCEMLYYLALRGRIEINPPLASVLLLGLVTDTGSFRFANTGARQLRLAASLLDSGADLALVGATAFESRDAESMALTGEVLRATHYLAGGRAVWSELRAATLASHGGAKNMPENLSSELRSVRGVRVAVLFVEVPGGGIRASLRSGGEVNVSEVAQEFGGGGHAGAAGVTISEGDYETLRDSIVKRVAETAESGD